ncbi:hypothetical protein [Streptacidiphilus sp. PAMC 29251]
MAGRPNKGEQVVIADRRAKLVAYRRKKIPYSTFYAELGYPSVQAATKDFTRTLQAAVAGQDAELEVYREEQLIELEYLAEEIHEIFRGEHFHVSASGRIAADPVTGEPLLDKSPNLAAADRLLKINAQVSKLRGLDQAVKIEGAFTVEALNRAIVDAQEQLAALGDEAPDDDEAEEPPG